MRTLVRIALGLGTAVMTACAGTATEESSTIEQALTEATASEDDAKATADACFATFESCKGAADADVDACREALHACLPAEAHPGPHCGPPRGKGKGHPNGPNGDCDGGARPEGGPPPGADGERPPPPEGDGDRPPPPDGDRPPPPDGGAPPARGDGGSEPGFCKRVPLPPPAEVVACNDALDACIADGSDEKTCRDAHRTCVEAAFEAAKAELDDANAS